MLSLWQFIEPQEKLEDIDSYIRTVLSDTCQCDIAEDNILNSFFSCPSEVPPDQVLYRATLTETVGSNCTQLVDHLKSIVQSDSAPPLVVVGNILEIRQDCNVEASDIDVDLSCTVPTGPLPTAAASTELAPIIGGVVAGVVLILLLILLLALVVACRRRNMKDM